MSNKPGVRHYFVECITSRGYISLLPNMMSCWQRTFVLWGGPGTGKSTMIKVLGLELLDRGYEVDFMRSARDVDANVGFIVRGVNLAVLAAAEVMPLRWRAPGVVEKLIDLGIYCDERKLAKQHSTVLALEQELLAIQRAIEEEMSEEFGAALRVPLRSQEPRKSNQPVYFPGDDRFSSEPWRLVQKALRKLQQSQVNPYFLHAVTAEGWLNLAPYFLGDCDQIRLEGEDTPSALDWVLEEAQFMGQLMEIILNPLNPDEVIGVVFPERSLAIWRGDPDNLADQGLNNPLRESLRVKLEHWQLKREQLKAIYTETMNFRQVDAVRDDLLNQILRELEETQG